MCRFRLHLFIFCCIRVTFGSPNTSIAAFQNDYCQVGVIGSINISWSPGSARSEVIEICSDSTLGLCPHDATEEPNRCQVRLKPDVEERSKCPYNYARTRINLKEPMWSPVRRNGYLGDFVYTELSGNVGRIFEKPLQYLNSYKISESNCVIHHENIFKAVPCNLKYPRLCNYKHLHILEDHFCSKESEYCIGTSFKSEINKCICLPQLIHPYMGCLKYTYLNSESENENKAEICKLTVKSYEYIKPVLTLSHFNDDFHLKVENKFLAHFDNNTIFCYRNVSENSSVFYEALSEEPYTFKAKQSGVYWCHGYYVKDFELVRSNEIVLIFDNRFTVEATFDYSSMEDPTNRALANQVFISHMFTSSSENCFAAAKVELVRVLSLNEERKEVSYLLHIYYRRRLRNFWHDYYCTIMVARNILKNLPRYTNSSPIYTLDYCLSEVTYYEGVKLSWNTTHANKTANLKIPNVKQHFVELSRTCIFDIHKGSRWGPVEITETFSVSSELMEILASNASTEEIIASLLPITSRTDVFQPVDVFLLSGILGKLKPSNFIEIENITQIVSNVMHVEKSTLLESQRKFNATDAILDNLDSILVSSKHIFTNKHIKTDNFLTFCFDGRSNISGIALTSEGKVNLPQNATLDYVLARPGLQVATYLPTYLLDSFRTDSKVVINIFLSDVLFNNDQHYLKVAAKNIAILLPEHKDPFEIPLIYRETQIQNTSGGCGYWQYGSKIKGRWVVEAKSTMINSKFHMCTFRHVTHFGLLVLEDVEEIERKGDVRILDLVTDIGSTLSLFGLAGILLTAVLFKTWRNNRGNQILMNYSVVSIVQIGLLYISNALYKNARKSVCVIFGIALHYTVLCQFCWMLVIAFLQYKRYVKVLDGPQTWILAKAYLVSYIFPAVPIIVLYFTSSENYAKGNVGLCYPTGPGLKYGILLPIGLVVIINTIIFFRIALEMLCVRKTKCIDDGLFTLRLRLVILQFFMLGITWTFGIIAQIFNDFLFVLLFCGTASVQGFVIFLFFVVFNENSRCMYLYMWNKYFCRS